MVIQRKGRAIKWEKIQKALKKYSPKDIGEVYYLLDDLKFNLSNEERCQVAQSWQMEKMILARHGIGI